MKFYVITSDGRRFGPADIAMLNQWISEGRITSNSELENSETGARQMASSVAGLVFQDQPATAEPPFMSPPQMGTSPYPRQGQYQNAPGVVPQQLQGGFNFGAFCFTWIWGLNHKAYWMLWGILISFIPCGGLIFSIYCGMKGNEAAWNSGRFGTPEECLACQKVWMYWGIGVIVAVAGLYFIGIMLGAVSEL